jgi:hypothetical protein
MIAPKLDLPSNHENASLELQNAAAILVFARSIPTSATRISS